MSTEHWIAIVGIVVGVVLALLGTAASVFVGFTSFLTRRSIDAADKKMDAAHDKIDQVVADVGTIRVDVAEVKKDIAHHSEKQDDFCDRLSAMEYTVRTVAAGRMP